MNSAASKLNSLLLEFSTILKEETFSVSGSTVYGDNETYPNDKSDLDLLALNSNSLGARLSSVCDTNPLNYLANESMDVVTLSTGQTVPAHIHVMTRPTYELLCSSFRFQMVCYRNLHAPGKNIKSVFPYYVSGVESDIWLSAAIEPCLDGHRIRLPSLAENVPSEWHINSFQDHILTQIEISDSQNILRTGRQNLAEKVAEFFANREAPPLNIHRGRMSRWSSSFTELMGSRYER